MLTYYSYQNLRSNSPDLAALEIAPKKPEELSLYETLMSMNMPFQEGGYIDQPWIIMQAIKTAAGARAQFS